MTVLQHATQQGHARANAVIAQTPQYIVRPGEPCTVVEFGGTTFERFPHAVADMFKAGVLTLSFPDGSERAFESEFWIRACVFDADGDQMYVTTNGAR